MEKEGKKAKTIKKRGLRFLYQLLCFVLTIMAGGTACVLFFQVEEIEVHGSTKYSKEQILSVANVSSDANLITLRASRIADKLEENLPYVNHVTVRRQLPSVLHIVVEECVPVARIQSGGTWWILASNGKVLEEVEESIASKYTQVVGITLFSPKVGEFAEASEEESRRLLGLYGLLSALDKKEIASDVQWIDLSADIEIEMDYIGKFIVKLPVNTESREVYGDSKYDRKIEILKLVVDHLDETDRGVIDLRQEQAYFRPR